MPTVREPVSGRMHGRSIPFRSRPLIFPCVIGSQTFPITSHENLIIGMCDFISAKLPA